MAWNGREAKLVAEAARFVEKGWRDLPEAVRGTALSIAVDAQPDLSERVLAAVCREPERARREEMMWALAGVRDRERQKQALGLVIDPKVDIRETMWLLYGLIFCSSTNSGERVDIRETMWLLYGWRTPADLAVAQQFYRDHAAAILKRMPTAETTGPLARLSGLFTATCRAEEREAVVDYVKKTFEPMPGGPRVVRQNIEAMDQCIASKRLLEPGARPPLCKGGDSVCHTRSVLGQQLPAIPRTHEAHERADRGQHARRRAGEHRDERLAHPLVALAEVEEQIAELLLARRVAAPARGLASCVVTPRGRHAARSSSRSAATASRCGPRAASSAPSLAHSANGGGRGGWAAAALAAPWRRVACEPRG